MGPSVGLPVLESHDLSVFFKAFIIDFQFVILTSILFMKYERAATVITFSELQTPPPQPGTN